MVAAPSGCASGSSTDPAGVAEAAVAATAAHPTGEFALTLGAGGNTVTAEGAFRLAEDQPALRLDMAGLPGGASLAVVLVDDMVYVKLPPEQSPQPDKPWLGVPADSDDPATARLTPLLDRLTRAVDPTTNLEILASGATVDEQGRDTVDGVATTRYAFTLDVAAALADPPEGTAEPSTALRELANQGVTTVSYTVWLDDDDLPRRFEMTQQTSGGPLTAKGTYAGWGQPVDIDPPPSAQTMRAGG
ncbi:MAG TPA: hypothetical protein VLB03_12050 [Nocardioidaceae bacterium]|nr:hypothetical protein [Nocardioidaceae bacterium]